MKLSDQYKQQAAEAALEFVQNGMVLGLGTGSTTNFALTKISEYLRRGKLKGIVGIPSSKKTERLARKLNIPLTDFSRIESIDMVLE